MIVCLEQLSSIKRGVQRRMTDTFLGQGHPVTYLLTVREREI